MAQGSISGSCVRQIDGHAETCWLFPGATHGERWGHMWGEPIPPALPTTMVCVLSLGGYLSICKLIQRYAERSGESSTIGTGGGMLVAVLQSGDGGSRHVRHLCETSLTQTKLHAPCLDAFPKCHNDPLPLRQEKGLPLRVLSPCVRPKNCNQSCLGVPTVTMPVYERESLV
jgi:hypothetical protein